MTESEEKVVASWVLEKYKGDLSREAEVYSVSRSTPKAYLLSDSVNFAWVPKSCVSPVNSVDYDKLYESEMSNVKLPLLHDRAHKYKDLFSYPLRQHQQDVVKTLRKSHKSYLGMDMGLGKTITSLAHIKLFKNDYPIQVICEKGLMQQWVEEVHKFAPEFDSRLRVMNYDKIVRPSCKEYLSELKPGKYFLILEEVSCLGNMGAKRTEMSVALSKQAFDVQMLSGSFFGGKFEKFYPCFTMQGFAGSQKDFEDLFTIKVPNMKTVRKGRRLVKVKDEQIVGYKNIDVLLKKSSDIGAVFLRTEDCIDLPEMNVSFVYVPLQDKAVRYESAFFNNADNMEDAKVNSMLVKIRKMNSAAENSNKIDAIKALLSESDDRFVIFYSFNDELDSLVALCKKLKRPISQWNGSTKDRSAFDSKRNAVILVQFQSGAKGLNLQAANKMIFTSPIPSDMYIQAKKRINRIGQKRKCFYWNLCSNDRFERHLYDKIMKLEDSVKKIG